MYGRPAGSPVHVWTVPWFLSLLSAQRLKSWADLFKSPCGDFTVLDLDNRESPGTEPPQDSLVCPRRAKLKDPPTASFGGRLSENKSERQGGEQNPGI